MFETPVVSYLINLPGHTNIRKAEAIALAEFPPGAHLGPLDTSDPACTLAAVFSEPVSEVLRKEGYGKGAVAEVALTSISPNNEAYESSDVTGLNFLATSGPHDLGTC